MTDTSYNKPLPLMEGLTKAFYDFCAQGELRFQRCTDCGAWRHVPREICAECSSFNWEWAQSSGRGTVYTWTVVERALHPAFGSSAPYAPVVVELEGGVRLLTQLSDVPPSELKIGMPVTVDFKAVTPEITLPYFKRA
ncbi:conserved protein of unknown function [Sterolibacterium denitrificans]|uniref:DNA-binding protein n=1 Tax=Sterolibacterium denitrificans TaxID=157592 RepID=A0A7Z7HR77_9PROT|nr:Zn-ribbon domain-containing OB-fold protein [Sterolibacterium denitrificans]SMB22483.1 conserved protein of unknown function [Sterolibacterium denitrificans]